MGETISDGVVIQHDVVKPEKSEDTVKERPSKKNRKKEKEPVEKPSVKSQIRKRLLVLPLQHLLLLFSYLFCWAPFMW